MKQNNKIKRNKIRKTKCDEKWKRSWAICENIMIYKWRWRGHTACNSLFYFTFLPFIYTKSHINFCCCFHLQFYRVERCTLHICAINWSVRNNRHLLYGDGEQDLLFSHLTQWHGVWPTNQPTDPSIDWPANRQDNQEGEFEPKGVIIWFEKSKQWILSTVISVGVCLSVCHLF